MRRPAQVPSHQQGRGIDFIQEQAAGGFRITSDTTIDAAMALKPGNEFNSFAGLYRDTRLVHSAALSDGRRILYHAEDVGRHSAVDKIIGFGFRHGIDFQQTVLLCSGRFSLEMVSKAARMQIPVYISPAAPSVETVQLAERIGMCLCGRTGRMFIQPHGVSAPRQHKQNPLFCSCDPFIALDILPVVMIAAFAC